MQPSSHQTRRAALHKFFGTSNTEWWSTLPGQKLIIGTTKSLETEVEVRNCDGSDVETPVEIVPHSTGLLLVQITTVAAANIYQFTNTWGEKTCIPLYGTDSASLGSIDNTNIRLELALRVAITRWQMGSTGHVISSDQAVRIHRAAKGKPDLATEATALAMNALQGRNLAEAHEWLTTEVTRDTQLRSNVDRSGALRVPRVARVVLEIIAPRHTQ